MTLTDMTPAELRTIRLDLRLTQTEWGEWLGVTPQHVAKLERGAAQISVQTAKLARAYADGWRPS